MIVSEEEAEEAWLVHPTPGICVKFKNTIFPSTSAYETSSSKFFINIAHCIEVPPPKEFLDEETVAKLLETDPGAFRIPICLGELDTTTDHGGHSVVKVDAIVNSQFFHKCIVESEFFKQIALQMISEMVQAKYCVQINIPSQVVLRNKKCIGELRPRQIRKRPLKPKLDSSERGKMAVPDQISADNDIDIDDIEETQPRKPRNFKIQVLKGRTVDVKVKVKDKEGSDVDDIRRLALKLNDDRIVILLDSSHTIADIHLPFKVEEGGEEDQFHFDPSTSVISMKCQIK